MSDKIGIAGTARSLLSTDMDNAARQAFGVGHAITSLSMSFLPLAASTVLWAGGSNAHDLPVVGIEPVLVGLLAGMLRNKAFDSITWDETKLAAIDVEFAWFAAKHINNQRRPVLRSFRGGLLNGLRKNGTAYILQTPLIPALWTALIFLGAASLTISGAKNILAFTKALRLENADKDPSAAMRNDRTDNMVAQSQDNDEMPGLKYLITPRNRDRAMRSVKAILDRQLARARALPPPQA